MGVLHRHGTTIPEQWIEGKLDMGRADRSGDSALNELTRKNIGTVAFESFRLEMFFLAA